MSGVPQGTVLEPLLFIVALSDMLSVAQVVSLASYADNTKIYQMIQNPGEVVHLQCELDAINRWDEENNMQFNAGKIPKPVLLTQKVQ